MNEWSSSCIPNMTILKNRTEKYCRTKKYSIRWLKKVSPFTAAFHFICKETHLDNWSPSKKSDRNLPYRQSSNRELNLLAWPFKRMVPCLYIRFPQLFMKGVLFFSQDCISHLIIMDFIKTFYLSFLPWEIECTFRLYCGPPWGRLFNTQNKAFMKRKDRIKTRSWNNKILSEQVSSYIHNIIYYQTLINNVMMNQVMMYAHFTSCVQ